MRFGAVADDAWAGLGAANLAVGREGERVLTVGPRHLR
jgi:hypothetical protein